MPYARSEISPSFVNAETAGWTRENNEWVDPAVTPQPIAVFDAASGVPLTENGQIAFDSATLNAASLSTIGPDDTPAYVTNYPAKPDAFAHALGKEWNYRIKIPTRHLVIGGKFYQPDNFQVKRFIEIQAPDAASIVNWQVGDTVTSSSGGTGTIYQISEGNSGPNAVVLDHYDGGHPTNSFENKTVTNDRNGESVSFGDMRLIGNNAKFFIAWTDDGTSHNGYSNSAMALGFEAAMPSEPAGPEHGYAKISGSSSDLHGSKGHPANQVPGFPDHPILWDLADNGSIVEIWYERIKTESGSGCTHRVWKKTHREGGAYPELTLIFQNDSQQSLTSFFDNHFTHGYVFGNKNGGYLVDTAFGTLRLEFWNQRPDFLPLIGE
jgi:hypothetical protein